MRQIATRALAVVGLQCSLFGQGVLTPSGAPAPTMRTLDQVEPRTPISTLPFTVTKPGSYYVTTNLTGSAGVTNGITITAGDVTLDLMGFALVGGAGSGISIAGVTNVAIRNGSVRGWPESGVAGVFSQNVLVELVAVSSNGQYGVNLGFSCVLNRITSTANGFGGIKVGSYNALSECAAYLNHNSGFIAGSGNTLIGCISSGNNGAGVVTGAGNTFTACTAESNAGVGLNAGDNCTFNGCTATANNGGGIQALNRANVVDCNASDNGAGSSGAGVTVSDSALVRGSVASLNRRDGIVVGARSTVQDCRADGNGTGTAGRGIAGSIRTVVRDSQTANNRAYGIEVSGDSVVTGCHASFNGQGIAAAGIKTTGSGSRIEGNHARDNTGWGVDASTGDIIIRNSAGGNSSGNYNPSTGAGFAPVQSPASATNPLANF